MKIEEFIETLPKEVISGEEVQLPEKSFHEIFNLVKMNENDVFYHLGCGDGSGVNIAAKEFHVRKAVGIDTNSQKISSAKNMFKNILNVDFKCEDIEDSDFSDATVILFWFTDEKIIEKMMSRFNQLKEGCKIITIWGPLPECLPEKVKFPYIMNQIPLKPAKDMQEQILSIFGVKCIDFVTAWEFAERYTKAIEAPNAENNRFVTIIQTLVIWINAKNLGVACGDEIPESIKTYMGILQNFYNIQTDHLLKK